MYRTIRLYGSKIINIVRFKFIFTDTDTLRVIHPTDTGFFLFSFQRMLFF